MHRNRSKNHTNKSGYVGVHFNKATNKWRASITINGQKKYLGQFETAELAANAYEQEALKYGIKTGFEKLTEEEKKIIWAENKKEWVEANKERYKTYWKEYYQKKRTENPEEIKRKTNEANRKVKEDVMKEYGGRCNCCGENILAFLTIDVIDSDNSIHEEAGYGKDFYRWLKKNGYPKDNYQCLCMNCNFAKGLFGKCPHQVERENVYNVEEENNV